MRIYIYIRIYISKFTRVYIVACKVYELSTCVSFFNRGARHVGLYTILSLTILNSIYYCNKCGRGETIYCTIVSAMKGGERGAQTKVVLQRVYLIRAHMPRNKTISCKGQTPWTSTSSLRPSSVQHQMLLYIYVYT